MNFAQVIKNYFSIYLAAFCIFLAFQPCFAWGWAFDASGVSCVLFVAISLRHIKADRKLLFLSLFLSFLYLIIAFRGGYSLLGIIALLLICPIFFMDGDYMKGVVHAFWDILAVILIVSLFVYILVVFINIPLPYDIIEPLNASKQFQYCRYPFLVMPDLGDLATLRFRFFSIYDEPGVVGTLCGVLLLVYKFNLKEWQNIPILIAGVLSTSMFFYAVVAVYVLLTAKVRYKVLTILVIAVAVALLSTNDIISELVFDRFSMEGGTFAGNHRDHFSAGWYQQFKKSDDYWFGLGANANFIYNYGGSSYRDIIINYGIIFFVAYMGVYVLMGLRKIKGLTAIIAYMLVLFGVIFQRPYINNIGYVFLIIAPLFSLAEFNKITFKHNERS